MYHYNAKLSRIIDGDTVDLDISLGFYTSIHVRCRLAHIDTPELHSKDYIERTYAKASADHLAVLLANPDIVIQSLKPFEGDKYGRWLVEIINAEGVNVNAAMIAGGFAKPYEGGTKT